jgi:hypothetical protein
VATASTDSAKELEERLFSSDNDTEQPANKQSGSKQPDETTSKPVSKPANKSASKPATASKPASDKPAPKQTDNSRKRKLEVPSVNRPGANKVAVIHEKLTPPPSARTRIPTPEECCAKLISDRDSAQWQSKLLQREVSTALDNNNALRQHNRALIQQLEERNRYVARLECKVDTLGRQVDQGSTFSQSSSASSN